ncbi:MAG TPA: B12-binding domain-containing protein [Candidatus Nitrosotalea sp.]|jgi:excisionase family DNA binding protein|nr:B12-binding domain-containing protein [Candidatus Nitrosotalea sp.]
MDPKPLSPGRLAPLIGVSESTLKRWIDAGYLRAEKTVGGHRKIALADVVAFLRATGRPVPSLEGLAALAEHTDASAEAPPSPDTLADLLVRGDQRVARALVINPFLAGMPLDEILDGLVAPAMTQIGARWARGEVDVYQEHAATLRAWSILMELRGLLPTPSDDAPLALGGAPEGDPYLLPTLMAELMLTEMGWRTLNLGPNTPIASLGEAITRHSPRLVWISVTSVSPHPSFFAVYPRVVEAAESRGIKFAAGGQGLHPDMRNAVRASLLGTHLAELRAFVRTLGR